MKRPKRLKELREVTRLHVYEEIINLVDDRRTPAAGAAFGETPVREERPIGHREDK